MLETSATWKALYQDENAWLQTVAVINGTEYYEISNPVINRALMQNGLSVGNVVSATCQFSVRTDDTIPKSAEVRIKMRYTNGAQTSEWLPAGTFYISHRQRDPVSGILSLECYDALLKANAEMPTIVPWTNQNGTPIKSNSGEMLYFQAAYPRSMLTVAREIAAMIGVEIDPRTSLATGSAYVVEMPEDGAQIHDILAKIAAANGGNWIITPLGKLRLVRVMNAANAASATSNVVNVAGIVSGFDTATTGIVTGIRCVEDEDTHLVGDETGLVIDADVTVPVALNLADWMLGLTYQSFELRGAVYDPAAEVGDYIRAGANGEVSAVLIVEAATLGPAFRGDLSSPQAGEMSDEYPYIGGSKKTLQIAKAYARKVTEALDESLNQEGMFNRLTNNGSVQGLYMIDGQLYVNMTYARSGTLVLGGLNNQNGLLEVRDANNNVIGTWNNNGILINKGELNTFGGTQALYKCSVKYGGIYIYVVDGSTEERIFQLSCNPSGQMHPVTFRARDSINIYTENGDAVTIQSNIGSIYPNAYLSVYSLTGIRAGYLVSQTGKKFMFGTEDYGTWFGLYNNNSIVAGITAYYEAPSYTGASIHISNGLSVSGTKSRLVHTEQYGERLLYCYETPSPMFGDVGEGVIGEDGRCYVWLDPVFAQTITATQYQVFLQKYGAGDCHVAERKGSYFVVEGTPGMAFGWELKAKQRDYDQYRLDKMDRHYGPETTDYGELASKYIDELKKERIPA